MPADARSAPPIANRISSSDQAIGWRTLTTTATSVSPIMIATNGRLPTPVAPPAR